MTVHRIRRLIRILAGFACLALATLASAQPPRERILADFGWKFLQGDPTGAEAPNYAAAWRTVNLPHDWSIEGKIDPKAPTGGGGGFFPTGVGWYRRDFNVPTTWQEKRVSIEFEGVYMNATVWLNGEQLGFHPYGYTSFRYDLTPHLKFGQPNTLAVRVDNSRQKNTRWYSGSGIYRHVWLEATLPLHVAPNGVFITTPEVSANRAKVAISTTLQNENKVKRALTLQTELLGPDGKKVGEGSSECELAPGASQELKQEITVARPALWSPESPKLYRAVTRIVRKNDGKMADSLSTPFGIRSLKWSVEKGLELNGQTIKLCGGCVHHDNGCLGAAAYDRAEERRVEQLKAAGFNAIRTSHNPPSPAFLDACDRLGMLVMDEAFDCWEKGKNPHDYSEWFKAWWQRDIDAMVLRDRNHPSVFCWSIGNEVPERALPQGVEIAKKLIAQVKRNDPSRPVTQAICDFWDNKGLQWADADAAYAQLDIGGYNYTLHNDQSDHQRAPLRIMVATESYAHDTFDYWRRVHEQSYVIGDFVWTALDYLGEAGIGRVNIGSDKNDGHGQGNLYPWHGGCCGDLDINCFRRPVSHYRNIIWGRGEKIFMTVRQPAPAGKQFHVTPWGLAPSLPSWTWPGCEGKPMTVEVYAVADKVQLYLNGKPLGEKPATRQEQFKAVFEVPYAPGTLRAVAMKGEKPAGEFTLQTAGEAAALRLTADRATLDATGQDLAFVTVEVTDKDGKLRPDAASMVEFSISGPGVIAGLANGDLKTEEPYQGTRHSVLNGRALVVIKAGREAGEIKLTAKSAGLKPATLTIKAEAASHPVATLP